MNKSSYIVFGGLAALIAVIAIAAYVKSNYSATDAATPPASTCPSNRDGC